MHDEDNKNGDDNSSCIPTRTDSPVQMQAFFYRIRKETNGLLSLMEIRGMPSRGFKRTCAERCKL